jgi:hypothetical protein
LRRLPREMDSLKQGHWQCAGMGQGLRGKNLGIWGYGKIGRLVAGYGRAFGMQVQVFGREKSIAEASADGYATVDRATLMASSDVVSLHVRLIPETRGLVTAEDLARDGAGLMLLINGFDETYGQDIRARHYYEHEDLRWNHRYSDIFSRPEQGPELVDFGKFHELEPMASED